MEEWMGRGKVRGVEMPMLNNEIPQNCKDTSSKINHFQLPGIRQSISLASLLRYQIPIELLPCVRQALCYIRDTKMSKIS